MSIASPFAKKLMDVSAHSGFKWPFPEVKKGIAPYPSSFAWRVRSTAAIALVGCFSKIWMTWFNQLNVHNKEILIEAVENRPPKKPLITISNHLSCMDDPLLWGVLRMKTLMNPQKMRWALAAHDICFTNPFYAWFFSSGRCIPVIRGSGKAMDFCLEMLNRGQWVHIFPEGRVNADHEPMRLKWGVGRLISELSDPPLVVPMWQEGMDAVLPNRQPYVPRTGNRVTLNLGRPMDFSALLRRLREDGASAMQKRRAVTDAIQSELRLLRTATRELHRASLRQQESLTPESLSTALVLVLPGPQEKFTAAECTALKQYVDGGGRLLVLMGEGGENKFKTNINFLLEQYGISVNNDAVVRTNYYKYYHPKECVIPDGILNRGVSKAAGALTDAYAETSSAKQALTFLYPFGATLNVMSPSVPILTTGTTSFPLNRPVCAAYQDPKTRGKILVLGSLEFLSDHYGDKEENARIRDVLFAFLTSDEVSFLNSDAEDPEISDYHRIPDTGRLASNLRACLQESEDVPTDFTQLFDNQCYAMDTRVLPAAVRAYEQLGVKHEPLRLITPQFETPLPLLQPAVFPPSFRELPNPSLELFDLDEAFSSEKARLAQITNKCSDSDLEYYIRECGEILGATARIPPGSRDAKRVLEFLFFQLVEFKKLNPGGEFAESATTLTGSLS
ncbi:unnamed protein product [Darwinula stevensoni]|uniref:Tafazzin n=1 Tax=Darwinula stevensoni TaxID=69355 RepID=A0A7R9FR64_9CRUS|nr:unnamed protein product [Darwinula stevensoni]CAG0901067.1 unnamed protein product [Darwinula stevensoni]